MTFCVIDALEARESLRGMQLFVERGAPDHLTAVVRWTEEVEHYLHRTLNTPWPRVFSMEPIGDGMFQGDIHVVYLVLGSAVAHALRFGKASIHHGDMCAVARLARTLCLLPPTQDERATWCRRFPYTEASLAHCQDARSRWSIVCAAVDLTEEFVSNYREDLTP